MPTVGTWTAPAPLSAAHDLTTFESGEPTLDHWLKTHALRNEGHGASRTYVVCNDDHVIGYYSLATGSICSELAPGRIRRNMPNPIPVMLLGRLAIDHAWQRRGIGRALLRDAILRTATVAQLVGVKALMVHALSESARLFYEAHGFAPSPTIRAPYSCIASCRAMSCTARKIAAVRAISGRVLLIVVADALVTINLEKAVCPQMNANNRRLRSVRPLTRTVKAGPSLSASLH